MKSSHMRGRFILTITPTARSMPSIRQTTSFNLRLFTVLFITLLAQLLSTTKLANCDEDSTQSSVVSIDGINIDQDLFEDTIDEALRSKDEQEKNEQASKDKNPFAKACPYGYFVCDNGECIAPRWRCDGHPDCDDFSDELNCTSIDLPQHSQMSSATNLSAQHLPNISSEHLSSFPVQVYGLDFNSSIEPLMIFSTGQSIRGLWMRSRVYFDVVTRKQVRSMSDVSAQPSITEAFSLFFGMLGFDPSRGGGGSLAADRDGSSAAAKSSGDQETPSKPENTIVGLDMNPVNKEVFWVELGKDPGVYSAVIEDEQFEDRHRRQFHGHKKIVEYGLLSPEDIALDTLGKNAYITDAGLPAVVVCSYVHVHCKLLVEDKIHKPRAIIADSASAWIIYTDWGDHPGIFLVSMDGLRRETLIETDVVWPNGLAQDYESNVLYWADARLNKIERVDLRTKRRTVLVKELGSNPFSVSVFENRVYWSDWSGNEIKTCDKITGNNTRNVIRANDIYGIHIYHPDMHKTSDASNPCWSKHCSHLCLLSPSPASTFGSRHYQSLGATCSCPHSMALNVFDKATCYEVHLSFLLVNVKNYIARVQPHRIGLRVIEDVIYSKDYAIHDIATDWAHFRLFFFDVSRKQIYSTDFSGRRASLQKFSTIGSKSIRSMLYDYQSDNLFWLDPEVGTLTLCAARGMKFQKILRHNLDFATSMVLDTKNRVFYIALMGVRPRIIRTDMMANEASDVVLVDRDEIGQPIALHLDEQMQRLYWADAKFGSIESVELDIKSRNNGCKPGTRQKHRSRLGPILSFTVFDDYFMWVLEDNDYIYKARRDDRHSRPVPLKLPPSISQDPMRTDYKRLTTVVPRTESATSPCSKRGCSHACMVDRDRDTRCICPEGFKLQTQNQSNCIDASKPDPNAVDRTLLRPSAIGQLVANSDKQAISGHEIDRLVHTKDPAQSKDMIVAEHVGQHPSVSHVKSGEMPHIILDEHGGFSHQAAQDQHIRGSGHATAEAIGAEPIESASPTGHSNKFVWLITFLLVLTGGSLITIISLMILNKQGRLPRNVSQLTVSFISPGSSSSSNSAGIDKDKTMLLLDTDS